MSETSRLSSNAFIFLSSKTTRSRFRRVLHKAEPETVANEVHVEKPLKKASHLLRAQEDLPSVPWMEKSTGTLLKSCSGCKLLVDSVLFVKKKWIFCILATIDLIFICVSSAFCVQNWEIYVDTWPSNDEGNYFLKPWDRMGCHIFRQASIERVWKWKHHVQPHAAHSLNPHWNVCSVYACIKNHWWFLSGTHLYIYIHLFCSGWLDCHCTYVYKYISIYI